MDSTVNRWKYSVPYEDIFSDDSAPKRGKAGQEKNFPSQLKPLVIANQLSDLQCLIQQQPDAWANISPEDLGNLLLAAAKQGYSNIINELIKQSKPGKVAAIPTKMQLELVEAARCERDSETETASLLNALLKHVDFPVQHLEGLLQQAGESRNHAVIDALSMYKHKFVGVRQMQYKDAIYDAAAAGDAAKLQKELDAKLGIPPVDNSLSGVEWFFNALHRWVMELVSTRAAKSLVNQEMGKVPLLHAAVASGSKETVLLLIGKGADMSKADADGRTALAKARELKKAEVIEVLLRHGAPEGCNAAGGLPATTPSASNPTRHVACVSERQESAASFPSSDDTMQLFNKLMPDVAASLSNSTLLEKELNNGKGLNTAQRGLLAAGYLAQFVPPSVHDVSHPRQESLTEVDKVAVQLQQHAVEFIACGERIEASRAKDIHRVLDNLASIDFDDILSNPDTIREQLRSTGLCEQLIEAIVTTRDAARADSQWAFALDSLRRKEILVTFLQEKLRQINDVSAPRKRRDRHPSLANKLLRRQIALLENYCKAAEELRKANAEPTVDFFDSF